MNHSPPLIPDERHLWQARPLKGDHPGGVNLSFSDGSVRFIKNSIDVQTWWALGTRGGAAVISADSY